MALEEARNPLKGVSGPGKYAKRIDRMPSNFYGDTSETAQLASGAPLAKSANTRPVPQGQLAAAVPNAPQPVTPLFAPTQRPNEPITAGIDRGAGPGSEALGTGQPTGKLSDTLAALLPYDTTGEISVLYQNALSRGQ
jgi:hypothetical protein